MYVNKTLKLFLFVFFAFPMFSYAEGSYISTTDGIETISKIIVLAGEVLGLSITLISLYGFYAHNNNPNQHPTGANVTGLIAGAFLTVSSAAYSWTVNSVASSANWVSDSSMLAVGSHINDSYDDMKDTFLGQYLTEDSFGTLMGFLFIIGLISFIRGLYLFKDSGKIDNSNESGIYKSIWHVIGGVSLMNITQVICFASWLLGIPLICAAT